MELHFPHILDHIQTMVKLVVNKDKQIILGSICGLFMKLIVNSKKW